MQLFFWIIAFLNNYNSQKMTQATPTPPTPQKKSRRQKSPDDVRTELFLKEIAKPYQRQLHLAWAFDVLSVAILIGQAVWLSAIFAESMGALRVGWGVGELAGQADGLGFFELFVPLCICLMVRPVVGFWREKILDQAGLSLSQSVQQKARQRLMVLGGGRRAFGADGAIASVIMDEPSRLQGFLRFSVQKMTAVTAPLIIAGAIMSKSVTAGLILLATAPLIPIFMAIIGIKTAKKSREQMDALAQLGGRFLDWVRGMNTLTRLGAVQIAQNDVEKSAGEYKTRTMSVLKIAFLNSVVLEFLSALSIALVAVYLGFGLMGLLPWKSGQVLTSFEVALFILLLVPEFYGALRRLGAEYHAKGEAVACAKVLSKFLADEPSSVAKALPTCLPPTLAPTIRFDNFSMIAPDGRVQVKLANFSVQAGQICLLKGQSGSGKSSILNALLGFLLGETKGDIWIDDVNFNAIDKTAWRQTVGFLAQTPALLPMTIGENLRLANDKASDDELLSVLDKVGLGQLIAHLPKGLDTPLLERGGGLSGGQAKRLAIAQLLLQNASVWLLDEPTEHLDAQTKTQIDDLLQTLCVGKTVIWVTHDDKAWAKQVYTLNNENNDNVGGANNDN